MLLVMDQHDIKNFQIIDELDLVKSGDIAVDVGANVGDYTSAFLYKLNGSGHVYSIELDPDTYRYLVTKFGYRLNLDIMNTAISDKDGSIDYYRHNTYHQMHSVSCGDGKVLAGKVSSSKLDTVLQSVGHISVLKIDIEGAEQFAIHGMIETLKKTDVIFLENHNAEAWLEVFPLLDSFACYNIESGRKIENELDSPYQTICVRKDNKELISRLEIFF